LSLTTWPARKIEVYPLSNVRIALELAPELRAQLGPVLRLVATESVPITRPQSDFVGYRKRMVAA
jgi:hypothetical protein